MITLYSVDFNRRCWITGKVDDKKEQRKLTAQWKADFPERTTYSLEGDAPVLVGSMLSIKRGKLELDSTGVPIHMLSEDKEIDREIDCAKEKAILEMIQPFLSKKARMRVGEKIRILQDRLPEARIDE